MNLLSELLSSKVRAEVFRLLFGLEDHMLHVREIQRRSGFAIGTVQTEMKKLTHMDLVEKKRDGNRLYYGARKSHPLFGDIQSLVLKTVGLADILKASLDGQPAISVAFVFGSLASGSGNAQSDIDLMVIGQLGLRQLTRHLSGLAEKLGREINPYVLTAEEFDHRLLQNDHFLTQVLEGHKLFIIGDADDLEKMARQRLASVS